MLQTTRRVSQYATNDSGSQIVQIIAPSVITNVLTDASALEKSLPDWLEELLAEQILFGHRRIREIDLRTELNDHFATA